MTKTLKQLATESKNTLASCNKYLDNQQQYIVDFLQSFISLDFNTTPLYYHFSAMKNHKKANKDIPTIVDYIKKNTNIVKIIMNIKQQSLKFIYKDNEKFTITTDLSTKWYEVEKEKTITEYDFNKSFENFVKKALKNDVNIDDIKKALESLTNL